jgi:hypothetical protein
MTADHSLEVGDLILKQYKYGTELVMVDRVFKKIVQVITPEGFHFIVDKQSDGELAYLPHGLINSFAKMVVIPRIENSISHIPFVTKKRRFKENPVIGAFRQFRKLFQNYRPIKTDIKLLNLTYRTSK